MQPLFMPKLLRWILLCPALILLGCSGPLTKEQATAQTNQIFEQASQRAVGASAAVAINGKLIWQYHWGFADKERKIATTSNTLFRVYSLAKPMTVAAALALREQNQLDPDAPINHYLPNYKGQGADSITTRMLATHRSGIRHYKDQAEALGDRHCTKVEDALPIFSDSPLQFEPDSQQGYSTWGFVLLSRVLEQVADQPFSQLMKTQVFDPANMRFIQHDNPKLSIANRATSYLIANDKLQTSPALDNSCKWGGGGYVASSTDIVNFLSALAQPGQLISAASADQIFRGDNEYSAIGWNDGGMGYMRIARKQKIAVAILTNTRDKELGIGYRDLLEQLTDIFSRVKTD